MVAIFDIINSIKGNNSISSEIDTILANDKITASIYYDTFKNNKTIMMDMYVIYEPLFKKVNEKWECIINTTELKEKCSNTTITEIGDDYIKFSNGTILKSIHDQECCECHWLDFSVMKFYNVATTTGKELDIYKTKFDFSKGIPFEKVEGMGILLIDTNGNKFLVNGYGENNGYYGNNINLIYSFNNMPIYWADVSKCQKIN